MDILLTLLQEQFGFKDFWPGQRPVIEKILDGVDTLAVMPTGSGKSLIYQLASLLLDGVTVCISPLIALMKDQVDFTQSIKRDWATFLNSSLSARERRLRLQDLAGGRYKLLYIAPERLRSPEFTSALNQMTVPLLVIDEAHCISFWGHDFRPDYLSIKDARARLPNHRLLALTATATPAIQNEIVNELAMTNPARIVLGFDRPNLLLEVIPTPTLARKYHTLRTLVERPRNERFSGPGVIYTGTRQEAEAISQYLVGLGIRAGFYHGGMNQDDRTRIQDSFRENRIRVLAATCAFGMGVDKPDIRFVIHWRLPANVETYYQEIGRAGRDGKPAHAVLFFSLGDQDLQARFITTDVPSTDELKTLRGQIADPGADGRIEDDLEILALQTGLDQTKLRVGISLLGRVGLLSRPSDDGKQWRTLSRLTREWKRHKFESLKKIVDYGRTLTCRRRFILEYFGEHRARPACGNCDTCLAPPGPLRQPSLEYIRTFLDLIRRRPADPKKAVQILAGSRARALRSIGPNEEPAWGRFKDYSQPFLDRKLSFLIENGYAAPPAAKNSPIELTDKGCALLAPTPAELPGDEVEEFNRGFDRAVALEPDSEILQSLRAWRFALANKKEVPAYRIFHNSVLEAIARHLPQTHEELERIRGVGDIKAAKYGPAILKFTRLLPGAVVLETKPVTTASVSGASVSDAKVSVSDANAPANGTTTDELILDTFTARFLAGPHPTRLAGRFDAGFALDFNSQFNGGDWQRTELGQLVYDLKYSSRRDRAPVLAQRLAQFLCDHAEFGRIDYLIPVPVSVTGRKFDPMLLVAQSLCRILSIPLGTALVKKTRETKPMKAMTNIAQKRNNIEGAFAVVSPAAIKNKRLLIVDDLYDTGSTVDAMVKTLHQAEATAVFYIALTKTIHRDE